MDKLLFVAWQCNLSESLVAVGDPKQLNAVSLRPQSPFIIHLACFFVTEGTEGYSNTDMKAIERSPGCRFQLCSVLECSTALLLVSGCVPRHHISWLCGLMDWAKSTQVHHLWK